MLTHFIVFKSGQIHKCPLASPLCSGTYGGRDGHLDCRRGSQGNCPNRNDNQNSSYRRGPQRDHPGDNFNQDVNFLGYRQNPMDWPALTEESWLKPIRELIRSELENWGPARW